MDPQVSEMVKKNIRKDLLTYCAQDTLAMVKLVEVLREASTLKPQAEG